MMDKEKQRERLEEILKLVAGFEESIRMSLENGDKEFAAKLSGMKKEYYERLKRVSYGLPEKRTVEAEADS